MQQSARETRALPAERVFVVQMHAEAALAQGQFAGRVEHVRSGQATHFDTVADFLAFLAQVLASMPAELSAQSCEPQS